VSNSLEQKKKLIERMKEKNPVYTEILSFYEKVIEAQEAEKPSVNVHYAGLTNTLKSIQTQEGFSLINKNDFVLDVPVATRTFESLCRIFRNANEKMREKIQAIEEAVSINALNLRELMKRHSDDVYVNSIAHEFDIDRAVLIFLLHSSIQPSLNSNVEQLKGNANIKNWLKGYCPICGSLPQISEIKGEGQRYFVCSFCSFQWPGERLKCPFCENTDHDKLHYFYEENKEAHRVDLCDNCKQYIKTVDSRKLDYEPELVLEDIVTIHLDILASEKGYKRPVPSPFGL
jgi:FdhE protein